MIANESDTAATEKIQSELVAAPCLAALLEAARVHEGEFRVEPDAPGLELSAANEIKGLPNRGRLKLFLPEDTRVVAVFFKPSNLSFSRDRFSYGGCLSSPSRLESEDLAGWLDYLIAGLSPAKRPKDLRRAFPYTIPE